MFMTTAKLRRKALPLFIGLALGSMSSAWAEQLTVLHVGDQESWLISAQGNLRDNAGQAISYYGGVDRLAAVIARAKEAAVGSTVITLNAGDAILPGPRFAASLKNLATAYEGGQDFYDAMATRQIGFDAMVFGNHEFDVDKAGRTAARFAEVSGSTYLSVNLDFGVTPEFAALQASGKVAPSKIITTQGGKKVAVIGATTPLLPAISSPPDGIMKHWSSDNSEAQNIEAINTLIQAEINRLRDNEGVTMVIVMSHMQNAQNELTRMIPALKGVDLVVSGGGHELMVDGDDKLIAGGVAPSFSTDPVYATDADGKQVPMVTGHFGNRYVGEIRFTIDDTTGLVSSVDSTRMIRVSGHPNDADKVAGDPALNASVVTPVFDYLAALNAQVIGTTATRLNGPTHVACGVAPCEYTEGVRNAETGLGNLVADAMRFAGQAEVAIQNGGGIRTNISAVGNVSVGDTFNVLPFTNLVKRAPAMNAAQLKDLMEHSVATASPRGTANGRFAQISGMKVWYDSRLTPRGTTIGSGERIRRIVLDDGTVLVDEGVVVNNERSFSFATIDFTANDGDGYPFKANAVAFENSTNTITYQEALANFIRTPKAEGGLKRDNAADGDEITTNMYGEENAFDLHGRLIDLAVGVAVQGVTRTGTAGRDVLVGTAGDDVITGGFGADRLTGGAGGDRFVYTSLRDAGDIITDFTPYADTLDLAQLLHGLGIDSANAVANGHIVVKDVSGGASVQIDIDGADSPMAPRPLVTLKGLTARQIVPARDFVLHRDSAM